MIQLVKRGLDGEEHETGRTKGIRIQIGFLLDIIFLDHTHRVI
jgi:hypothetical protein